jgi:hypothetical protein
MWVSLPLLFAGVLTGLLLVSIYEPVPLHKKVLPDMGHPEMVMKQEDIDNGCFRMVPYEVPCPADADSLNLLSLQYK